MKLCPECGKTYDDIVQICPTCAQTLPHTDTTLTENEKSDCCSKKESFSIAGIILAGISASLSAALYRAIVSPQLSYPISKKAAQDVSTGAAITGVLVFIGIYSLYAKLLLHFKNNKISFSALWETYGLRLKIPNFSEKIDQLPKKYPTIIPSSISVIMLLLAIPPIWPYGYYTLLRLVVCGTASFIAYRSHKLHRQFLTYITGFLALLFNPIIPVHLDKEFWGILDLTAAAIIFVSTWLLREPKNDK